MRLSCRMGASLLLAALGPWGRVAFSAQPIENPVLLPEFAVNVSVELGGEEVSLAEAIHSTASDSRLIAYQELREAHGGSVQGQHQLALWCRRNRLADEERSHWRILLDMRPGHPEAVRGLGQREYQGMLLSPEEIQQAKLAKRSERAWRPKLKRIKRAIERGNDQDRSAALREMQAIDDPHALSVIEEVFSGGDADLGLLLVEMMAGVAEQQGVDALVRLAIHSESQKVRRRAVHELKYHQSDSYLTPLMMSLAAPIEVSEHVTVKRGGVSLTRIRASSPLTAFIDAPRLLDSQASVGSGLVSTWQSFGGNPAVEVREHHMRKPLPDQNTYNYTLQAESPDPRHPYEYTGFLTSTSPRGTGIAGSSKLQRSIAMLKDKIIQANSRSTELNQWIDEALRQLTGVDVHPSFAVGEGQEKSDIQPHLWWRWWRKHAWPKDYFAAGVEVWTQSGLEPIETVSVGDRVLARDSQTEKLSFLQVVGVDIQPQENLVFITAGLRTIVTTQDQELLAEGGGWTAAGKLTDAESLATLGGPLAITTISQDRFDKTYRLILSDNDDLIIGRQGIVSRSAARHQ